MLHLSRAVLTAALAVLVAGCVTTDAARLSTSTAYRPPVPPGYVSLYRTPGQVPRPYEEIALLSSSGDVDFTDQASMIESMRQKAGELGANGIILETIEEPSPGAEVAAAIFGVLVNRKGKAIAIWVFPAGAHGADPIRHH
ncbi:MAG: hypothetical protein M3Q42_11340 [Pseudomonadota bacterium]|nr:hypothetical protein [Pseudomonadota bacterium]